MLIQSGMGLEGPTAALYIKKHNASITRTEKKINIINQSLNFTKMTLYKTLRLQLAPNNYKKLQDMTNHIDVGDETAWDGKISLARISKTTTTRLKARCLPIVEPTGRNGGGRHEYAEEDLIERLFGKEG